MSKLISSIVAFGVLMVNIVQGAQVVINTPEAPWNAGSIVTVTWSYNASATGVPADTPAQLVLMKVCIVLSTNCLNS
jgi:hypothetical protein